jgi:hypothetical protein
LGISSSNLTETNLYNCEAGNTILRLWYSVLASPIIWTLSISNILKNKGHEIKMEDVCKEHCQDDYSKIPVWEKLIAPF